MAKIHGTQVLGTSKENTMEPIIEINWLSLFEVLVIISGISLVIMLMIKATVAYLKKVKEPDI
jgi:uncharacterized membrane protein